MIIKRTWFRYPKNRPMYRYNYTGYFLLGIIPIYIVRETI